MLLHKSVVHDTRVRREASALAEAGHEVVVVHLPAAPFHDEVSPAPAGAPFRTISATLPRARRHLPRPARLAAEAASIGWRAAATRPDAIHAHDAAMLLPGLGAARARGARLVYDSHELATGVAYHRGAWASVVATAERIGAPRADATMTVSDGIAEALRGRYSLREAPAVVRNLPDLPAPDPASAPDLRRELGIGDAPLVMHHGAVTTGRGGETLLQALTEVPDAHVAFLGVEGADAERLRARARLLRLGRRAHILPPVPPEALLSHTAQADLGVSLLADSCENHRLALPNKLFEYLAAGLPVVVSDLPEAAKLVRESGIGWCADPSDPAAVAATLRTGLSSCRDPRLLDRVRAAAGELTWKLEKERLLAVYERLAEGGGSHGS